MFVCVRVCAWLLNNLCYWQMLRRFILFFWSVPSFLWLLLCIIFLKWSFLWFTTWWWMLPSSNVHMMCAHFCIQVNWHLTEIIGNQWFWLRRRLLCVFFFVVVRTLRFELQQQWKLHRRQDIGEKWHQPIALNSIGGGAWTAYKIKPEFNVECCIYCCCCRRFQGGSFSHDESQTLHSLIAHNIQFQVYYL